LLGCEMTKTRGRLRARLESRPRRRLDGAGADILEGAEFASGHGVTFSIVTLGKSTFLTVRVFGSNSNKSARSTFLYLAASIAASSIEKWMLGFSVGQTMQSIKVITKNQIFICPLRRLQAVRLTSTAPDLKKFRDCRLREVSCPFSSLSRKAPSGKYFPESSSMKALSRWLL
jgi:hypothetical protein